MLGMKHTYALKEGGGDIELSHENKEEFVQLYVDWALNVSIAEPFEAFRCDCHCNTLQPLTFWQGWLPCRLRRVEGTDSIPNL